ncbi:LOW QUALITY PROTEIN: hypothetical protein Cgig2_009087 [Carnegiea gigantea]|uniref:Peptidase A2 domain-containing protein n=1 Tax=Carnegiea gigantea TaxID=171969 RepID=A0A9Q1KD91_9CARY|nr:LOW QUALITY PROTEIN: hypothetical protein Cgig2_009087 [Carnegiea gigantea]
MTGTITQQVLELKRLWRQRTRPGRFLILITYLPMDASLPTGRSGYHLPVTQSGSGRYLDQSGAVSPIQSSKVDAWQRDLTATHDRALEAAECLEYCEFHEQSGHTTTECRELKKVLYELASKERPTFPSTREEPTQLQPRDEECSTEVMATIAGSYAEEMIRSAQQVLTTEQGPRIMVTTMVFGGKEAPRFASPHNDPLVVEMKIASAIRILIDTGSSTDIITWDFLKKLTHPGRDIVPLVHPLGFGGQEVNPTGMIRLSICFGDKLKAKNLEVDFLVVDVPTAYNVILGRLTLYKALPLPLPDGARHRLSLAQEWRPRPQRPSTSPSFPLHKIKGKSGHNQTERLTNTGAIDTLRKILKDQNARCSKEEVVCEKLQLREPIQRFPVTRLALPPLRALHRFYWLSHKLGDGSGLIVLPYVELEVAGHFPLLSRGFPEGVPNSRTFPQPDSRRTKRKSYFQYFSFDFFTMAVMNSDPLLKQYHPKSLVSLGALWTVYMRLNARAEQGRESDCPDHVAGPTGLGPPGTLVPFTTISGTSPTRERPFRLSTDLPGVEGHSWDKELIDAPSEDQCLNDLSEEEEEVSPEVELVLVEATSAPDARGRGILAARPRESAWFERRHRIENLFGFPILILSEDARNHSTINKGWEVRELRVAALHLGTGQPFRNVPTG